MGLTEALARSAGIEIHEIGTLQLVAFCDVSLFLDACEAATVVVLGIEGFYLVGDQVRADLTSIADFSQLTDSKTSLLEARAFIDVAGRPRMLFEFELADDPRTTT